MARAGVAKLADALDSKSSGAYTPCGFDSRPRHHVKLRSKLHKFFVPVNAPQRFR